MSTRLPTGTTLTCRLGKKAKSPWTTTTIRLVFPSHEVELPANGRHWRVTLKNPKGTLRFDYWESINDMFLALGYEVTGHHVTQVTPQPCTPTADDILSCLDPCVGDFTSWADSLGYSVDSIKAHKAWKESRRVSDSLQRMFTKTELEQWYD